MPAAVPVTYRDFLRLQSGLWHMGFTEMDYEDDTITVDEGSLPPKVISGEVGFVYRKNGYVVKVWTTCLRCVIEECSKIPSLFMDTAVSRPPGEDMGWVVITDQRDKEQYFTRPTLRTKGFITTFLRRAWITWKKVALRPRCPECQRLMTIFRKKSRATFWACFLSEAHRERKPTWKDWDFCLTEKERGYAEGWRKEYHRYLDQQHKKGHIPQRASAIRKLRKMAKRLS